MMQNLKNYVEVLPALHIISPQLKNLCMALVEQFYEQIQDQIQINGTQIYEDQLKKLFATLNSSNKISMLEDPNHRVLIIIYMKQLGIEHYKYSYFNKAKLTNKHLEILNKVGPILFSEAVMIASKINIIINNSSRIYIEDQLYTESQSPVDIKIQEILKLCDDKKRKVNNNLKKLELILEGEEYVQVIKQLGKMLRDSWKKDKSKSKCVDVVKNLVKGALLPELQLHSVSWGQNYFEYDFDVISRVSEKSYNFDKYSFAPSPTLSIQPQKQYAKLAQKHENSFCFFDGEESQLFVQQIDYFNSFLD